MFVDEAKLKTAVKSSWKGQGVTVSRTGGRYHIFCDRFAFSIREELLPNKIKALIVELCGDLPEEEEGLTFRKGCEVQEAMALSLLAKESTETVCRTRVLFNLKSGTVCRVWKGKACVAVPENLSFMTDGGDLDKSETEPEGPFLVEGNRLQWENNVSTLEVYAASAVEEDAELLEAFEDMDAINLIGF